MNSIVVSKFLVLCSKLQTFVVLLNVLHFSKIYKNQNFLIFILQHISKILVQTYSKSMIYFELTLKLHNYGKFDNYNQIKVNEQK